MKIKQSTLSRRRLIELAGATAALTTIGRHLPAQAANSRRARVSASSAQARWAAPSAAPG